MPPYDGVNYPGPYELRLFYTWTYGGLTYNSVFRHSLDMQTPADPGDPFEDWLCQSRTGDLPYLDVWTDALVALIKVFYHTSSNFGHAELWEFDPGTYNAHFLSTYTVGVAGTSATATKRASQMILTLRAQNGGSCRLTLGGVVLDVNVTDPYPFANTDANNLADFCVGPDSPLIARDGSYAFSPLNYMVGENERYFKKLYRP